MLSVYIICVHETCNLCRISTLHDNTEYCVVLASRITTQPVGRLYQFSRHLMFVWWKKCITEVNDVNACTWWACCGWEGAFSQGAKMVQFTRGGRLDNSTVHILLVAWLSMSRIYREKKLSTEVHCWFLKETRYAIQQELYFNSTELLSPKIVNIYWRFFSSWSNLLYLVLLRFQLLNGRSISNDF